MSDPLSVVSLAAGSRGGRVDGVDAAQLVAAGLTLLQRSARLVRALSGRRAAILLPTSPQVITALAACEGRGAVLVNPLAAGPEIDYQFSDASVGALFTTEPMLRRSNCRALPDAVVLLDDAPRTARVLVGGDEQVVDLGSHVGLDLAGDAAAEGRDEEAVIVYTSAMSGYAAGAILTHRNLISNAWATVDAAQLSPDDHSLAILPFSHMFGLVVSGIAPLLSGGRVTTMGRFNPIAAVEALATQDISVVVGVPAIFMGLLAALARRGGKLEAPALRLCICGGAVLPPEVQDMWFDATGVELRQGYGLTEAGPVCLFNRVDLPNRRGTLGLPFPGVDVSVRDDEICVRGPNVFAGYVNDRQGLEQRDGWLHTGDLGVANADGTFSFTGLRKPMFTRNGFNVYPAELQRVVREMPGVVDVTVTPIAEPSRENDIRIEVAGGVSPDDVKAWCAERLSVYKQPSEVLIRA